jgi:hypothetical protein
MNQEPPRENLESMDMSETDVERLLVDAYVVPPVPKSLLKRFGRVADQWGESTRSAQGPTWLAEVSFRAARSWKTWPVAACLAFAFVLAVSFRGDVYACNWAAVVKALSNQSVVQLGAAGANGAESAWMSLPGGKISRRSGDTERLYDLRQGVVLERGPSDVQIRRLRLSGITAASDLERVALSFLIGDPNSRQSNTLYFPEPRLLEQSSSRRGNTVELKVTFGSDKSGDELHMTLVVDRRTHLPLSCLISVRGAVVREETFTYPTSPPEQLIAQSFPAEIPIMDVASGIVTVSSAFPAANAFAMEADTVLNSAEDRASAPGDRNATSGPDVTWAGAASLGWAPITPSRLSSDEVVSAVDALLDRLWREHGITPVEPADDSELLRRAYLDLTGRTPSVAEVRSYLNDSAPDRYALLTDRLLASRDHATHLATVWRTFLLPEGIDLDRFGGIPAFDDWLSSRFESGAPYDQLVRELLLAEGRLSQSGPLLFYSAAKLNADQLAARTSRVFLGMRLECAQCHDDPFEPWTQQDFWSYAAFFARISRPQAALESASTVMRVHDIDRGEVMMPESAEPVAPQYLDGSKLPETEAAPRRQQLASWLTSPENPYFARAAVNRVWAHMFGHGIVDPVDGFGKRNPPRSPELLDLLAARFIASNFNLRDTFRTIARSRAYQLSSESASDDKQRQEWFAQMNVKMLTAEQIYDCITVASMLISTESNGFSIARTDDSNRTEFLLQFKTLSGRPTEYQGGIPQALTLMNGSLINSATDLAGSGLLKSLDAPFFTDDQRIEVIYLATLARRPSPGELSLLREYLANREPGASVQESLADVLWALLNGAEFTMNH